MRILYFIIVYFLLQNSFAQLKCKTIQKHDTIITKCFHKNGKTSTKQESYNKRDGKIIGYNSKDEILFEFYTRTYAGHAYVAVDYYENGQVKKVYYSSAPDAGIQWYHITIKFDENGKEIDRQEESNEDILHPKFITIFKDAIYKPLAKNIDSTMLFVNEYYVINASNYSISFTKMQDTSKKKSIIIIQPKDTLYIYKEYNENIFKLIERIPKISLLKNKKVKKYSIYIGEFVIVNYRLKKQYFLLF